MAKRDYITGKRHMHGNTVCFSKKKANRRFDLNLQTVNLEIKPGTFKRVKVTARTLKTLKKQGKVVNKYAKNKGSNVPLNSAAAVDKLAEKETEEEIKTPELPENL